MTRSRVNARVSEEVARQLEALERELGMSTTDVLRESIAHYYLATSAGSGEAAERFTRAGFIACAEGAPTLSSDYKAELGRSLGKKA